MHRVHYRIDGLINNHSKTHLKNALNKIQGVKMVNVDLERGSVEVGFDESTNATQIKNTITDTGFTILDG
ncbi:MAG: heavy-metal-associated domain-containing protein [Clostridiaceae bacterium]|nr:heavy-metal-associated domain-containing protein [Clostridiaceae bacterium]